MSAYHYICGMVAIMTCLVHYAPYVWSTVAVDSDPSEYAEQLPSSWPWYLSPNLLVNIGYIMVAFYWAAIVIPQQRIAAMGRTIIDTFCALALCYAPIQWLRVATASRTFSIMDQWLTLPFFAWATYSCMVLRYKVGFTSRHIICVMVGSLATYAAAIYYPPFGFEMTLMVHMINVLVACFYLAATPIPSTYGNIAAAIKKMDTITGDHDNDDDEDDTAGDRAWERAHQIGSATPFKPIVPSARVRSRYMDLVLGLVCCTAFVVLKLGDHWLAAQHPIFRIISGHFLSKIGDFGQIHYLLCFLSHEMASMPSSLATAS